MYLCFNGSDFPVPSKGFLKISLSKSFIFLLSSCQFFANPNNRTKIHQQIHISFYSSIKSSENDLPLLNLSIAESNLLSLVLFDNS